jgi:GNAT superfamily N-acetyltransferase
MIVLRRVIATDEQDWLALWRGYQEFYRVQIPEHATRHTWSRLLDAEVPMQATLALRDGCAIGLVHHLYHLSTWSQADTCYLQDLFVTPAARGSGAGRRLIEHVYAEAAARGCEQVYWLTHHTNHPAMALYNKIATPTGFLHYERPLPIEPTP